MNHQKYTALIFDFDYTLGDTTLSIAASINYALERLGYAPRSVGEIRKTIGYPLQIAFRMLTGESDAEKERRFFDEFQIKADEVMTADARLYPDTERLLRTWGRKYAIGIVSTKHRFRIEDILRKFALTDCVSVVVGNEDVEYEKPDPESVLLAVRLIGVQPGQALYVGDSLVDAEAAARAGIDFAGVTTGTTTREQFEAFPAVAVVRDLKDLEAMLKRGETHE